MLLLHSVKFGLPGLMLAALAGCTPDYSPNTYASNAVQQANKVEPAVVAGFREVKISADGTGGAVTGGAARGILGSPTGPAGIRSAPAPRRRPGRGRRGGPTPEPAARRTPRRGGIARQP